jgi:alpha-tubulin suppressor-like RCC1 family protein
MVSASENSTTVCDSEGEAHIWGEFDTDDDHKEERFGRIVHAVAGHACVMRMNQFGDVAVSRSLDVGRHKSGGSPSLGMFAASSTVHDELSRILTPPLVKDFSARIMQIAIGRVHALALTEDGKVFSWGGDAAGQCGHGRFRIGEALNRISIGGSPPASTGRRKNRSSYGGGSPPPHQSFLMLDKPSGPRQIISLEGEHVASIRACRYSSGCRTIDGKLFCFGDNRNGNLGLGDKSTRDSPILVATISEKVVDFDMGSKHTLAVTEDGSLYSWGDNARGQLGRDLEGSQSNTWPGIVTVPTRVTACAAGGEHSLCLTDDGSVYSWGSNDAHACGCEDSCTESITNPHKIMNLPNMVAIAAGAKHSITVDVDGAVWGFGSNANGQLGIDFEYDVATAPVVLG